MWSADWLSTGTTDSNLSAANSLSSAKSAASKASNNSKAGGKLSGMMRFMTQGGSAASSAEQKGPDYKGDLVEGKANGQGM